MKSAMSTKVYWKARKLIQSIGFRCKSLLYTYMDRAEVIKESSSIKHVIAKQALKEGIRGVIWALIALIIDVVFQQILNISADNRRVFVSVIICTIGVAGVILGLYCSSITSIYSTRYANAPEKVALAFQRDWLTRRSISSIISYIISGMAVIIEVLLGCAVGWASVALLVSRLVYLLVAYGIAGNRSYQLSDVYHVADDSYRILFRIIRKRLKQNVFSADASFQNHFLREAEKKIDLSGYLGTQNRKKSFEFTSY